jgi:hypothetical protein
MEARSGKSFFMAKLRERIDQLAAAARAKPTAESWFCGRRGEIIQIEFGDWPALRRAVRRVARFSFETGRVLAAHLADDEPEGEAEPS